MTGIIWPDTVVHAATHNSLVLFVGAGVSASCSNDLGNFPPNWTELLRTLSQKVSLEIDEKQELVDLINSGHLLDAAELLSFKSTDAGYPADFTKVLTDAISGPKAHRFQPSDWHIAIGNINPPIIVTTNYDKIIEQADGLDYATATYDSHDIDSLIRSGTPTLIKLHGTVDAPSSIILSRSDYARLHRDGTLALDVVRALMLTHTFLFVGYSLSDPDIRALLQDVFAARSHRNTCPHYWFTSDSLSAYNRKAHLHCYGIQAVTYPSSDVGYGLRAFQDLARQVGAAPFAGF